MKNWKEYCQHMTTFILCVLCVFVDTRSCYYVIYLKREFGYLFICYFPQYTCRQNVNFTYKMCHMLTNNCLIKLNQFFLIDYLELPKQLINLVSAVEITVGAILEFPNIHLSEPIRSWAQPVFFFSNNWLNLKLLDKWTLEQTLMC